MASQRCPRLDASPIERWVDVWLPFLRSGWVLIASIGGVWLCNFQGQVIKARELRLLGWDTGPRSPEPPCKKAHHLRPCREPHAGLRLTVSAAVSPSSSEPRRQTREGRSHMGSRVASRSPASRSREELTGSRALSNPDPQNHVHKKCVFFSLHP